MNRRAFLAGFGTTASATFSGCAQDSADLIVSNVQIDSESREPTTIDVGLRTTQTADGDRVFHDVRIVAYSVEGTLVGDREIQAFGPPGERVKNLSVECDGFPLVVTCDAAESPCDGGISITNSTYQGKQEGEHYWLSDRNRECNEGLPPEIPETSVTPPQ